MLGKWQECVDCGFRRWTGFTLEEMEADYPIHGAIESKGVGE